MRLLTILTILGIYCSCCYSKSSLEHFHLTMNELHNVFEKSDDIQVAEIMLGGYQLIFLWKIEILSQTEFLNKNINKDIMDKIYEWYKTNKNKISEELNSKIDELFRYVEIQMISDEYYSKDWPFPDKSKYIDKLSPIYDIINSLCITKLSN